MPHFDVSETGVAESREIKLARLVNLPSLPALLMQALQYTGCNQDLTQLADKIGQDPPMVIRILRIANSPFYGMPREIGSLREAIVLLGLNRVRDLLVSVCFLKILPSQHPDFNYPQFWHHSLAVADCARQLGLHAGISEDIAFAAGLLHDIGLLAIVLLFPEEYSRILKSIHPNRLEIERRIMGVDHVEIGSKVAEHWNLPTAIQEAIEQHETQPELDKGVSLGVLIYTANQLVKELGLPGHNSAVCQEKLTDALALQGLSYELALAWGERSLQFADQILANV